LIQGVTVIKHFAFFLIIAFLLTIIVSYASGTGSIFITTQPVGATVFLDGSRIGDTPLPLGGIPVGKHNLKVSLKNYEDVGREIEVTNDDTLTINIIMEEKEEISPGTVIVNSNPKNAIVNFDKVNIGKTPAKLENVSEGPHDIEIILEGYKSHSEKINVVTGETITLEVNLSSIEIIPPDLSPSPKETKNSGEDVFLTIRTRPPDAQIYINGKLSGNSPQIDIPVKPGKYDIKIVKSGFQTHKEEIEVSNKSSGEILISLEKSEGFDIKTGAHYIYIFIILVILAIIFLVAVKFIFSGQKSFKKGLIIEEKYNIESQRGEDSFFMIYKGSQKSSGTEVMLKVPLPYLAEDPIFLSLFTENLKDFKSLNHPHIVNLYDCSAEKSSIYVATEFFEGETIEEIISRHKKLDLRQIVNIIYQTSLALSYAHGKNIIHGDLQPSRIIINKEGQIKVNYFCIYKDIYYHTINSIGVYKGNILYMASEKLEKKAVDFRADLFSLGVIFYRLLTGELPYEGETPHLLLESQYYKEIRVLPSFNIKIPEKIKEVVLNLIQIDPYQRGKSTEQIMKLLKGIKDNL